MTRHYSPEQSRLDVAFGMNAGPHHFVDPSFELHTHDFIELVIVLGGRGLHLTSLGDYAIAAGDVFVVTGSLAHGFARSAGMKIVNFMLTERFLEDTGRWLRQLPGYHALFVLEPVYRHRHGLRNRLRLNAPDLKRVARLVALLDGELRSERPGCRAAATGLWLEILTFLCRRFSGADARAAPYFPLAGTIAFMEERFTEPLSLADLAARACLSPNQFIRVFRQHYGTTPNRYLIELRIAEARRLLAGTSRTVTDIAYSCGFGDSNYFARLFRQATGMSPRAFRGQEPPIGGPADL